MERYFAIINDTQLHFDVGEGDVKLFDTSMEFDGQIFENSQQILDHLIAKFGGN